MNNDNKIELFDIPVQLNIWIRPELQKKQFEVIKKIKPKILVLVSDGGRNESENEAIKANRFLYEDGVDWECTVYKLYEKKNNGLYAMIKKTQKFVWENFDWCIFLEDDQIPSVSFFWFCREMLIKYKNDLRIQGINGFNPFGVISNLSSDYFFSNVASSWGIATWKRSNDIIRWNDFDYIDDEYTLNLLKKNMNKYEYSKAIEVANKGIVDGHIPDRELACMISKITENIMFITPKYNLISCLGCGNDSAHSSSINTLPKEIRNLYNSKAYELSFPLKHPKYMIRDTIFEEKMDKLLAYNYPLKTKYRRVIKAIKTIKYEGIKSLIAKYKKVYNYKKQN